MIHQKTPNQIEFLFIPFIRFEKGSPIFAKDCSMKTGQYHAMGDPNDFPRFASLGLESARSDWLGGELTFSLFRAPRSPFGQWEERSPVGTDS